jgi:hypothetical protein
VGLLATVAGLIAAPGPLAGEPASPAVKVKCFLNATSVLNDDHGPTDAVRLCAYAETTADARGWAARAQNSEVRGIESAAPIHVAGVGVRQRLGVVSQDAPINDAAEHQFVIPTSHAPV